MVDDFDIEDLSGVMQLRALKEEDSWESREKRDTLEDLSLPISIAAEEAELDDSVRIVDTLTRMERNVYRSTQGSYMRYRVGVLGIGRMVEEIHTQVEMRFAELSDLLIRDLGVWARYDVGLFGGRARQQVARSDVELLADQLIYFKPNYLMLVNAGQVKHKFAHRSPHELALLSKQINSGAQKNGQRPYDLVFVTDEPISEQTYAHYERSCQQLDTRAASMQFLVDQTDRIVAHARGCLRQHTDRYLRRL